MTSIGMGQQCISGLFLTIEEKTTNQQQKEGFIDVGMHIITQLEDRNDGAESN